MSVEMSRVMGHTLARSSPYGEAAVTRQPLDRGDVMERARVKPRLRWVAYGAYAVAVAAMYLPVVLLLSFS